MDVVVGYNAGLRTFDVDPTTRAAQRLIGDGTGHLDSGGGEGLCAYHSAATGDLYVFVITRRRRVRQYLSTTPTMTACSRGPWSGSSGRLGGRGLRRRRRHR